MGNGSSGNWVKALELGDAVAALRGLLTPWPEALRALGGLQTKRVGANVGAAVREAWGVKLADAGVVDGEGRLTTLGAALAVEESERMFLEAFDL